MNCDDGRYREVGIHFIQRYEVRWVPSKINYPHVASAWAKVFGPGAGPGFKAVLSVLSSAGLKQLSTMFLSNC